MAPWLVQYHPLFSQLLINGLLLPRKLSVCLSVCRTRQLWPNDIVSPQFNLIYTTWWPGDLAILWRKHGQNICRGYETGHWYVEQGYVQNNHRAIVPAYLLTLTHSSSAATIITG